MRLFANELDKAKKNQRKQGSKARYWEVHWVEPEMADDDSGDDTTQLWCILCIYMHVVEERTMKGNHASIYYVSYI
jgi:hypothetical protein